MSRTNPRITSAMAPYIIMGPRSWRFLRKELIVLDDLGGVRFNMRVSFYAKRYKEHSIPLARETILPEKDNLCAGGLQEHVPERRQVYR
jgi:hypothetical protein